MTLKQLHVKDLLFFASIIGLAILSFFVLKPFIAIIVISLVIVELLSPLNEFLEKKLKRKTLAASLSTLIAFLIILLPLVLIGTIAVKQAVEIKNSADVFIEENSILDTEGAVISDSINKVFDLIGVDITIGPLDYESIILSFFGELTNVATSAFDLLKNFIVVSFQIIFLFYTMFHLFKEYGNLREAFYTFSPMEQEVNEIFVGKFVSISHSIFKNNVIIGIIVGSVGTIGLVIAGVDSPIFLGLLMTAVSIIPLGAVIVWLPTALLMLASGRPVAGVFLLLWGILVIGLIDDFVRPALLKKDTNLHPLILFFSIVGGIEVFGIIGLIYGPLIFVLFLSLFEAYKHKYKNL